VYAAVMAKAADAPSAAPTAAAEPAKPAVRKVTFPADAPSKGPKAAKVTIVAWSDFECPFCGRVNPTLKQIEESYGKDVRVVFRHQPLPFHQSAKLAAEASMAAHEQGKFWEFHDKLFANQRALDRASLERYAQELGLNAGKFKSALDSGKFRSRVEQDARDGAAVGANGTPTFFVNGREVVGALPFGSFKSIIDEEIAKADKLLASGTKLEDVYEKLMAQGAAAAPAAPEAGAPAAPAAVQKVELGNAPVKGPKNAPVTIVAFSDFECPFCGRVNPTLKQIEDTYKGKVKIAFKHQPLPFHQNAKPAAMASLAAHEQGKFWEYHDKLFANQRALDRASLERYAQELGLNVAKFKAALDSNKFEAQVTADSQEGMRLGANGTPTFFINGRQLVGALPFDSFKSVIDEELSKAGTVARDAK
jgi:protein-disulfide isomerase